jgi:hypothetical protein
VIVFLPSQTVYAPIASAQIPAPVVVVQQVIEEPEPPKEVIEEDPILCNCYAYAKQVYPTLPTTKKLLASTSKKFGKVAVFDYDGLPHYAVVDSMGIGTFTVTETNYKRCQRTTRTIKFNDPALVGFWSPD